MAITTTVQVPAKATLKLVTEHGIQSDVDEELLDGKPLVVRY